MDRLFFLWAGLNIRSSFFSLFLLVEKDVGRVFLGACLSRSLHTYQGASGWQVHIRTMQTWLCLNLQEDI